MISLDKNKIKEIICCYLESKQEILFAYLFGSFCLKDKYRDIDIAVYLNPEFNFRDTDKYPYGYESDIIGELNLKLKTDNIDFIVLNKANLLLSKQVYNTGVLLFERDRFFRIKVVNSIRKEYIDTRHLSQIRELYTKKYLDVRQGSNK